MSVKLGIMCTNSTIRETDSTVTAALRCASIVQAVHNCSAKWYGSLQVRVCLTAREKNDLEAQGPRRKLKSRVFRRMLFEIDSGGRLMR
jgi:hypothetical protein